MPKLPSKPGSNMAEAIQQSIESEIRSQVHDFLTGVIRSALSRASPIVGMLADVVASKLEKFATDSALPQVRLVDKPVTSTTTISSQRTRVDYAQTSIIAQCDLGKLITLNREKKTYYVTPLATGSALVSNGMPGDPTAIHVQIERTTDTKTQTIAGLTAHHVVETLTAIGVSAPSVSTDKWYAISDVVNGCARPGEPAGSYIEIPLRLEHKVDTSTSPVPLPTGMGLDIAKLLTVRVETTSVSKIPYDPALFEAPPDYVETSPFGTPLVGQQNPAPVSAH